MRRGIARFMEREVPMKCPRPRKQLLLKLGVFLLLGAIVNVAVAWGCAWHANNDDTRPRKSIDHAPVEQADWDWWTLRAPSGMVKPFEVNEWFNVGFRERRVCGDGPIISTSPPTTLLEQSVRLRAGWPMLSLYGEWFSVPMPAAVRGYGTITSGCIDLHKHNLARIVSTPLVPFVPIWPGFAINTIFYAAMLWLLWIATGKIRRFIIVRGRVRQGRCPACGFIIAPGTAAASGGPCSECGAASPRSHLRIAERGR
jgi:hypothetical protein